MMSGPTHGARGPFTLGFCCIGGQVLFGYNLGEHESIDRPEVSCPSFGRPSITLPPPRATVRVLLLSGYILPHHLLAASPGRQRRNRDSAPPPDTG